MPRIIIETIPAEKQRYDTLGDWRYNENGDLIITVSDYSVLEPSGFLIALHELVEVALCRRRGVSQDAVDNFDMAFAGEGEPGDDPGSPYRREHRFSMMIEHLVAHEMGVVGYGKVE